MARRRGKATPGIGNIGSGHPSLFAKQAVVVIRLIGSNPIVSAHNLVNCVGAGPLG